VLGCVSRLSRLWVLQKWRGNQHAEYKNFIRSAGDFEFEKAVSQTNRVLSRNIETIFLLANPSLSIVSSSIVRDVIINGGDPKPFVPEEIEALVHL